MDPVDYIRFRMTHPATRPPNGYIDLFYDMTLSSPVLMGQDGVKTPVGSGAVPPAPVWGTITGNLVDQADLAAELDGKFSKLGGAITGDVSISLALQTMGLLVSDSVAFAATNYTYAAGAAEAHRAALGIVDPLPPAAPAWGDITGTLSTQADLQSALDAKASTAALADKAPLLNPVFPSALQVVGAATMASTLNVVGVATFQQPIVGSLAVVVRSHSTTDDTIGADDRYVRSTSDVDVVQRVPNDSVVNFPIGTKVTLRQAGQGTITLDPDTGVVLHGQTSTAARHRSLGIIKVGPNEWDTERGAF